MTVKQATQNGFNVEVSHFRLSYTDFKKISATAQNLRKLVADLHEDEINYDKIYRLLNVNLVPRPSFEHGNQISPRGGQTQVVVEKDGKKSVGISHCYFTDNFSRSEGISFALKRAIDDYQNRIHI